MPAVLQLVTYLFPARYYMLVNRTLFLKGTEPAVLVPQLVALAIYAHRDADRRVGALSQEARLDVLAPGAADGVEASSSSCRATGCCCRSSSSCR